MGTKRRDEQQGEVCWRTVRLSLDIGAEVEGDGK
jgi:hypothetical protein